MLKTVSEHMSNIVSNVKIVCEDYAYKIKSLLRNFHDRH